MVQNKTQLRKLLETNDRAVLRALVVLHDRQTEGERATQSTRLLNNEGFNASDARLLSLYAEQVKAGCKLAPSVIAIARSRLLKYAGQLVDLAAEKASRKAVRKVIPKPVEIPEASINDKIVAYGRSPGPHYAPTNGICWHCSRQIFRVISLAQAASGNISGCPYCSRTYVD